MNGNMDILQLSDDGKRLMNIAYGYYATIEIPEGVEVIEPITIDYLQIELLKIPSTVRQMNVCWIGRVCHRFEVAEGNQCYTSVDGVLYNHDCTTLISVPESQDPKYQIPQSVTRIGTYALACNDIQLHIPSHINKIERCSIYPSDHLELIWCDILHPELIEIDAEAFDCVMDGTALIVPYEAMSRYKAHPVFAGCNIVSSFDELVEQQNGLLVLAEGGKRLINVVGHDENYEIEVVYLPASITEVDARVLWWANLRAILVHPDNRSFRSVKGALCNYEMTELIRVPAQCSSFEWYWPKTVTRIHSYAFSGSNLFDFEIPPHVTHIGAYAFEDNNVLEEVNISENVVEIDETAFCFCEELREITVDPRNPYYSSSHGVLYDKHQQRIIFIPNAFEGKEDFRLIPSVRTIGSKAYLQMDTLRVLDLSEHVRKIEPHAFDSCYGARTVVVHQVDPDRIEVAEDAFDLVYYNEETGEQDYMFMELCLYVPSESIERYRKHPVWGKFPEIKSLESFDRGEYPLSEDFEAETVDIQDETNEQQPTETELANMASACQRAQCCIREIRPIVEEYMRNHRGISEPLSEVKTDLQYAHYLFTHLYDDRIQNEWSNGWITRHQTLFEAMKESSKEIMEEHQLPNAKEANGYLMKISRLQYIVDHPDDFIEDKALLYQLTWMLKLARLAEEHGMPILSID